MNTFMSLVVANLEQCVLTGERVGVCMSVQVYVAAHLEQCVLDE